MSYAAKVIPEPSNPLGLDGIEFIEYATSQPQAFGALLQQMGFAAVARHRSREVLLYRQGEMNVIVNSHEATSASPVLGAMALRVRDAGYAHRHSVELGAWEIEPHAAAMELNIPGIHGVGDSLSTSWTATDFPLRRRHVPFAALSRPQALAALHWFGVVQAILGERTRRLGGLYETLFGFPCPARRYWRAPERQLLESPCHKFTCS
jgi:4-hydroxyphenylpyruvate dioxygenase